MDNVTDWLQKYGRQLVLFARQWIDSHADAEDVVQEAFVKFLPRRETVEQPLAYLYRCVKNEAINWQRSQQRRIRREQQHTEQQRAEEGSLFAQSKNDLPEQNELRSRIEAVLQQLSIEQREIIVLHIWSELTFEQIGDVLSIPRSTAHVRYQAALKTLKTFLGKETE